MLQLEDPTFDVMCADIVNSKPGQVSCMGQNSKSLNQIMIADLLTFKDIT